MQKLGIRFRNDSKKLANEIAQLKNDRSNQERRRALNGRVPASEVEAFLAEDADTGVSFDVRRAQAAKKRYDFYMKHVLPLRSTVAAAAKMDLGYDWKPMNDQQFQCMLDEVKQFSQRSGGFDQSAAQQGALPGGAQPFEDGPSDVDYEIDGQEGM